MKKCFKTIALAMCVVFLAGSVWAASLDDHVKIAPNGKGDVLIYPFYAAIAGGWETKLTVVNTSDEYSTVAKVIVRSPIFSEEILDFFIYLSPTDVWTGTLKFDAADGTIMESDDDSIVARLDGAGNPVWGDAETARRALVIPKGAGDFNEMGYIYVVNIATWNEGPPPVNKDDIFDEYQNIAAISPNYLPQNILAGWTDFQVAGFGLTSGLSAVTLRDYQNREVATIAFATLLGNEALNTIMEVEAALAKNDIAMPYLNNEDISLHFLTFPTKYSFETDGIVDSVRSPFDGFRADRNFCVRYQLSIFDTTEDSLTPADPIWSPAPPQEFADLCNELNWIVSDGAPFEEGWINYNFDYTTVGANFLEDMTYTGAPVIPVSLNIGESGMSLKYGAWTDGEVSSTAWFDGAVIDFYQYSDFGINALNNIE